MQHEFRAATAPPHAGTVETHPDEIADRSFHDTAADRKVFPPEAAVAHPVSLVGQVVQSCRQALSLALVPGSRSGSCCERCAQGGEDRADPDVTQVPGVLGDPCLQFGGALVMQAFARGPELLDDVEPVDTWLGVREVLLLRAPDVLRAVGEKDRALVTVAALVGELAQALEQRVVAVEGVAFNNTSGVQKDYTLKMYVGTWNGLASTTYGVAWSSW